MTRNEMDRFNCEQVFKRLDDYLDHELTPDEMERITEHLEICAWCANTYEFQAGILNELRDRLQRVPAPTHLRAKIAGALAKARAEASDA
jgi:anti-sigma factor (TIGR02949 family)